MEKLNLFMSFSGCHTHLLFILISGCFTQVHFLADQGIAIQAWMVTIFSWAMSRL